MVHVGRHVPQACALTNPLLKPTALVPCPPPHIAAWCLFWGFSGRTAVAINHMMARTRSAAWQKLELLTVLGLFAQLTVLCIHVVTTKHASRTTVAGFIGTILSTVIQTWHLMQQFADKYTDFDIILLHFSRISQFRSTPHVPCDTLRLVPMLIVC